MLTIKCAGCKTKIFKYKKIGKGKVLYCYKERIKEDFSYKDVKEYKCMKCGKVIGLDQGGRIKMKQNAFTTSGFKI
jgi:ribosomal protein S27E